VADLPLDDQLYAKTKTHPGFGVKIRGLYRGIFPKRLRIENFRIMLKSGDFAGVFGRRIGKSEPDTGFFYM
jgi:hypothetical protein